MARQRSIVRIPIPASIPVGHRVRATYFTLQVSGIFGRRSEMTLGPLVEDLDTGVRYGVVELFADVSSYQVGTPSEVPYEPRADMTPTRSVEGRVVACAVVYVGGDLLQSTLAIESGD